MTGRPFEVAGVRVAHDRATMDELEAAGYDDPLARLEALLDRPAVAEAFVLATCNRVEEYVVTDDYATGTAALEDFAPGVPDDAVVTTGHEASLRHLLRVAAGLESQVLGEDQIIGQVRDAYATASEAGAIGPVLDAGLLKAIHVGERARAETGINDGIVSLGSAAVRLAGRDRELDGAAVLVVGAGEMAGTAARAFADVGVAALRVINRSPGRAAALARELPVPARHGGLDDLAADVAAADVVVSCTANPGPVIDRGIAAAAGETLFIDIAQPRDVAADVAGVQGATVHDLDGLEAVTRATHEERREAVEAVEALIDEEFDLLMDQYKRRRADAVVAAMYRGAERIKRRQVETALAKLEAGDAATDREAVVSDLADALVSQLLAVPTRSLREAAANDDWETITTAIELFDPDVDDPRDFFMAEAGSVGISPDSAVED